MFDKNTSIANYSPSQRLFRAFEKAENGGKISLGFLGGSITMGCNASTVDKRYVNIIAQWWKDKFPKAEVSFVNAGIGATTSEFAAARVYDDMLRYQPDFATIEFSVNDSDTDHFKETFEGTVRQILKYETQPALIVINNLFYNTGENAQRVHNEVAKHYDLPIVSVRDHIYPLIQSGEAVLSDYTKDMLHPEDKGQAMIAELVIFMLEKQYADYNNGVIAPEFEMPRPVTANTYENSVRYRNQDIAPELNGFTADTSADNGITDIFKHGWTAEAKGSSIKFKVSGQNIAIQWRRTINKPAPIAKAVLDGCEEKAVILDANFDEDWGDLICLTDILEKGTSGEHTLEITITDEGKSGSSFYLVSVIAGE